MTQTLYFAADNGAQGTELWRIAENGDLSVAKDIFSGNSGSSPSNFVAYNGELYFNATTADGRGFWKVARDGTIAPVAGPEGNVSEASGAGVANGRLFFFANGPWGYELNAIGPDGKIQIRADLSPTGDSGGRGFTDVGDTTYFIAQTPEYGRELWKVSVGGTVSKVPEVSPGTDWSDPDFLTAFGGTLYFTATGPVGRELYRLRADGSPELVRDINPHASSSGPSELTLFNGELYFSATSASGGNELWKVASNGIVYPRHELEPGVSSSWPAEFTLFNGSLYFSASTGDNRELFRVAPNGDIGQVTAINSNGLADPKNFAVLGDAMYFTANDGTHGVELWKLTATGTISLVKDINTGAASSSPSRFVASGGSLYFTANTATAGVEMWRISSLGTVTQISDLRPGTTSSIFGAPQIGVMDSTATFAAPQITSHSGGGYVEFEVKENTTAATTVKATDADGSAGSRFILAGSDAASFTISAAGKLSFKTAPDFENPKDAHNEFGSDNFYLVTVYVVDADGLSDSQSFAIGVIDVKGVTYNGSPGANSKTGTPEDDVLKGNGGGDTLKGAGGSDTITGGDGHDRLYGGDGRDTLSGGGGNDTLSGGDGKDKLTGGAGKDRFDFKTAVSSGADTITDFSHADDTIGLENTIFKALGASVTSSEFRARASGHAADSTDHLIYDKSNGTLWYDADSNGTGAAKQIAQLGTASSHPVNLTYADFLIV